jgi:hypothetical protein
MLVRDTLERLLRRSLKYAIEGRATPVVMYIPDSTTICTVKWLPKLLESHAQALRKVKLFFYENIEEFFESLYSSLLNSTSQGVLIVMFNDSIACNSQCTEIID